MSSLLSNPYLNFYSYNGNTYSTKLHALMAASRYNDINDAKEQISWRAPAFDKFGGSTENLEPSGSLKSYYLQRAIDIRQRYDYVILHYSGGSDSHNILETFMLNSLHLDEIAIHYYPPSHNLQDDRYKLCDHFDEVPKCAKPLAEFFISTYSPHTKLTIKTNVKESIINFWQNINESSYTDIFKTMLDVWLIRDPVRMYNIQDYSDDPRRWQKLKETKKVAHVFGLEKPMLFLENNIVYTCISDNLLNGRCDNTRKYDSNGLPYNVEYFYIHPDFFELYLKGAHTLWNNSQLHPDLIYNAVSLDDSFINAGRESQALTEIKNRSFKTSGRDYQDLCAKFLYETKITPNFQTIKVGDLLFNGSFGSLPQSIKEVYYETLNLGLISGAPYNVDYVIYAFIKGNDLAHNNYIKFLDTLCSLFPGRSKFQILSALRKNYLMKFNLK